jgi:hypothetical protein
MTVEYNNRVKAHEKEVENISRKEALKEIVKINQAVARNEIHCESAIKLIGDVLSQVVDNLD